MQKTMIFLLIIFYDFRIFNEFIYSSCDDFVEVKVIYFFCLCLLFDSYVLLFFLLLCVMKFFFSFLLLQWEWVEDEKPSFKALQGGLLVAPILQKLILNREPERVLEWVDKVSEWPIERIIPCHFANDIKASSADFKKAFEFLQEPKEKNLVDDFLSIFDNKKSKNICPIGVKEDIALLSTISKTLTDQGVLFPEAALVPRN